MSSMHWLWLGALALILLSLAVLLAPLLREHAPAGDSRNDAVLRRIYQSQWEELAREQRAGHLSEQDHAQARDELQRRLLAELENRPAPARWRHRPWLARASALAVAVLLPVAAFALYLQVGDPQAAARLAQADEVGHGGADAQVEAMVEGLARRLRAEPRNVPGWVMLARSYETLERYDAAAQAYSQALAGARLGEPDKELEARLLADMADALGSAQGGDLQGRAGAAIEEALRLDPRQHKALALAGSAAVRQGDFALAATHWRALLAQLEPGSDIALRVQDDLLQLETLDASAPPPAAPAAPAAARADANRLSGEIHWPGSIRAMALPPEAKVFVIVRAAAQPQPVAVLRLPASPLPTRFALDAAQLLNPAVVIADFGALQVSARLSPSGAALAAAGDLRSEPLTASPGDSALRLEMPQR